MALHRLPPLGGIRAFEAAGRLLSFSRAADELSVPQGAVSHQIKQLEDEGYRVAASDVAAEKVGSCCGGCQS